MKKNGIKKLVCIAMSAAMLLMTAVPAFAADPATNTVDVTYTETESYAWSIPSSAVTAGNSMTVSISQNKIASKKKLSITVSGANDASSKHYLVDSSDPTNKLEYEMKINSTALGTDATVLTKSAAETGSTTVTTTVKDTASKAGTYTDTLTFTATTGEAATSLASVINQKYWCEGYIYIQSTVEISNLKVRAERYESDTATNPYDTFGPESLSSKKNGDNYLYSGTDKLSDYLNGYKWARIYVYDASGTYSGELEFTNGIQNFGSWLS